MTKHIDLIRKMAWLWHETTGIEWDELFSEACLAYSLAIQGHKVEKEAKLSTFAYQRIEFRLIHFAKYHLRTKNIGNIEDWAGAVESTPDYEFFEELKEDYTADVMTIIRMVRRKPNRYSRIGLTSRSGVGNIRKDLRRKTE